MPISLEDTEAGKVIAQRGRTKGLAEGLADGESAVLAELLAARFGADERIPAIARRLAGLGEKSAVAAALSAGSLDELTT